MKVTKRTGVAAVAAINAARASAAATTFCPGSSKDVCFGWGVPETTSSSDSGNLYFQLSAPTTYEWIGLGIGSAMRGADIFVIYQDGDGNVTLSTREGTGHVMPMYVEREDVELLEGSGVEGDMMVANVRCGKCDNVDFGGEGSWIAAWKEGESLDSTSMSETISFHDANSVFKVDLATASISSDANPFMDSGSDDGTGSGSDSGSGGVTETGGEEEEESKMLLYAHGIIMSLVFVLGFPVGGIIMPLVSKWFIHAGWQMLAFLGMWAGFGIGYTIADRDGEFFTNTHTRMGTIVVALMALQPILGWVHHSQFKKTGSRGVVSHVHVWYGRALMIIGIVNGGLGLKLASGPRSWIIAYSVVSGIVGALYVASALFGARKSKTTRGEKALSPSRTHETSPERHV